MRTETPPQAGWLEKLVVGALRQRLLVLALLAGLIVGGLQALSTLRIDALPDLTNNQVQVLTQARGLAPTEIEQRVTFPVETALQGLPDVEQLRSTSRFGLSVVTIVFADSVDPFFARQLVFERIQQAKSQLPATADEPTLGPMTSGLGEIYMYVVEAPHPEDPRAVMDVRALQDWIVKPQLRAVPGVTEVNTFGGLTRQYQVVIDLPKMAARGVSLDEVFTAVGEASSVTGGNYVERGHEQYIVRGIGLVESLDDLRQTIVAERGGVPVLVRDVADVAFGPEVRQGAVSADGKGEVVTGIVMMRRGENSRAVIERVKDKVSALNATLPEGVRIAPYYDQTELVDRTIRTVETNLLEGGALVVIVLFVFLRNIRAALLVAATIPLSMLVAFIGMARFGISANLMSLGAIDFGLIVDGSVVMVENAMRQLALPENAGRTRLQATAASLREVARPIFFGVLIIMVVYLPILTLQGLEGKMFAPMALTVGFALLGSLLLALVAVPVVASYALPERPAPHRQPVMDRLRAAYARALAAAVGKPRRILGLTAATFLASLLLLPLLGSEFMPEMDEGSLAIQAIRLPSASLSESLASQALIEKALREFPEVTRVVSRTGRADIASDPMGVNMTDVFVSLAPPRTWRYEDKDALVEALRERLGRIPGVNYNFTQPIAMRVDELISGVKSDVAIKLFGEDLDTLSRTANRLAAVISKVPGAREVNVEQVEGQTYLNVRIDRHAAARYGVGVARIQELIEGAIGGRAVGQVFEGQRRFDLLVKLPEASRATPEAIRGLLIDTPGGRLIPLGQVAAVVEEEGPAQISREDTQRRIVVEANVAGRDIGSFVADAQAAIRREAELPTGYFVTWGGQFENQQRAMGRLVVVVPLAVALIGLLLYFSFGSAGLAGLVMLILPLATVGGVAALWLRGLHLSVSAAIGFIALFGIATLNGVVLMSVMRARTLAGDTPVQAALTGAGLRLRPVLMTALVAGVGFLPMAFSHGAGAELQRPLATVVIGGLVSATMLTLFVLPTLYVMFERRFGSLRRTAARAE